jgi:hypothetical protein
VCLCSDGISSSQAHSPGVATADHVRFYDFASSDLFGSVLSRHAALLMCFYEVCAVPLVCYMDCAVLKVVSEHQSAHLFTSFQQVSTSD